MVYKCLNSIQNMLNTTATALLHTQKDCAFCARYIIPSPKSLRDQNLSTSIRPFSQNLICDYCATALFRDPINCFNCGIPVPSTQRGTSTQQICGECLSQSPIQYRSICAFDYLFPLTEWLPEIKYQKQFNSVKPLSALFAEYCQSMYPTLADQTGSRQKESLPELIIPVPLHPNREFVRGFNQTKLFTQAISQHLNIPYSDNSVRRINNTAAQMTLSLKERDINMKNAFKVINIPQAKHIALFDDIMTTGSTLRALAKPLKQAGVQRIDFWSLCRTPKPI